MQTVNKNAVLAHLEHITAVALAIRVSKIQSATIPIPRSTVVATMLADALTQASPNRVRNGVVSSTPFYEVDKKEDPD